MAATTPNLIGSIILDNERSYCAHCALRAKTLAYNICLSTLAIVVTLATT